MLVAHGDSRSGNCYKVKLLLGHLGLSFDWREYDVTQAPTTRRCEPGSSGSRIGPDM